MWHKNVNYMNVTVSAPAKINLTLEVLGKRDDGYHEIRTVLQAISLADTLSFETSGRLEFRSDMADWVGEKSLVSRAAVLLKEKTGSAEGASVFVEKRIPLLSGLGGDSSNAAAALVGFDRLWGLGVGIEGLLPMARQLGSDVPFFLYGGTVLASGRGEVITRLQAGPRLWLVLVVPSVARVPGKTKQLYQSLRPNHYTDGSITQRLASALEATGEGFGSSLVFNAFENVAFEQYPGLGTVREHMLKMGAPNVHLAGSGPTLFALFGDKSRAEDMHTQMKRQKLDTFLAETLP